MAAFTPKTIGLKRKGVERVRLDVKIDGILMEELAALEKRIEEEAPEYQLVRVDIIEAAFREAIRSLSSDLDRMPKAGKAPAEALS